MNRSISLGVLRIAPAPAIVVSFIPNGSASLFASNS